MAKRNEPTESAAPAATDRLAELIAEKRAAGLPQKQAEECARAQIAHDAELAKAAKK